MEKPIDVDVLQVGERQLQRKIVKYLRLTTNQPDITSSPNPSPTTEQHVGVSIQVNSHMSYIFGEIHTRQCYCPFSLLSAAMAERQS